MYSVHLFPDSRERSSVMNSTDHLSIDDTSALATDVSPSAVDAGMPDTIVDAEYDVHGLVYVTHPRFPLTPSIAGTDVTVRADVSSLAGTLVVEATGDDVDEFEANLADDPTVRTVRLIAAGPASRTYAVEVDESNTAHLFPALRLAQLHLLDVRADRFGWQISFETADRTAVRTLADGVDDDATFDVRRLGPTTTVRSDDDPSLTPRQREVLRTALERGYFAVPRGCSQTDLAEEFDVTPAAVSQQVRRAVRGLIETTGLAEAA